MSFAVRASADNGVTRLLPVIPLCIPARASTLHRLVQRRPPAHDAARRDTGWTLPRPADPLAVNPASNAAPYGHALRRAPDRRRSSRANPACNFGWPPSSSPTVLTFRAWSSRALR